MLLAPPLVPPVPPQATARAAVARAATAVDRCRLDPLLISSVSPPFATWGVRGNAGILERRLDHLPGRDGARGGLDDDLDQIGIPEGREGSVALQAAGQEVLVLVAEALLVGDVGTGVGPDRTGHDRVAPGVDEATSGAQRLDHEGPGLAGLVVGREAGEELRQAAVGHLQLEGHLLLA